MIVFNKYRNNPCFFTAIRELDSIIGEFIYASNGSLTSANVVVIEAPWDYTPHYPYTLLTFEFSLPNSIFISTDFIHLPGHLYFNRGEELSLFVLRNDLIRGDLSSYESSQLIEEEI